MRTDVYARWKRPQVDLRFFRGQRVTARFMNDTQIAAKFKTVWFTARVLGKGNSIGTYELHFDPCASNDNDEEDTHPRTAPFAGVRDGSGLAKGAAVMKELTGDFTWDSVQAS